MPFNGSGVYTLPAGNPVVTGTVISSTVQNNTMSDVATALTDCVTRDGQSPPTQNLPMGNFHLTGLSVGTARTDSATVGQLQDNSASILSTVGGTGDAITAGATPALTAYNTGAQFVYVPTATNTVGTPTINISALGAKTITQSNGQGLWAGAFVVGTPYLLYFDGTNFRVQAGQLGNAIVQMGSPFAFRNRIIDGNFDFWSIANSFNITGANASYTADMWSCSAGNLASATVSRFLFTPGAEPLGMTSPVSGGMQFQQTVANSSQGGIAAKIEGASTLEGRSATLSLWLWTATGTMTITQAYVNQFFGSTGSAAVLTPSTVNWVLTTTPQKFSLRIDVPSISGKTISGSADNIQVGLIFPPSVTFTLRTAQWQLEDCPASAPIAGLPTPFEWRGYATEKSMIGRYFEKIGGTAQFDVIFQGATNAGSIAVNSMIPFSYKKRATPAASLVGTWNTTNVSGLSASCFGVDNIDLAATSSAAGQVAWNTVNTTTYLLADARL